MIQHYYLETVPNLGQEVGTEIEASPFARFESGFDMSMSRDCLLYTSPSPRD